MSTTIQSLGIDRMSPQERLKLIEEIWDSLGPTEQFEIPQSHREELDHRIAAADANPSDAEPWEVVRERLRGGP